MEKFKILIVDDIDKNIYALTTILEKNPNFEIIGSSNALDALSLVDKQTIDLILCDVQMPNIDGFEFVSIMRLRKKTADIPVIFVTAHSKDNVFFKKSTDLDAIDYLIKPIDENELLHRISSYYIFTMRERKKNLEIINLKKNLEITSLNNSLLEENKKTLLANEHYKQLYKNMADGFFIASINGLIIESNRAFSSLCGYTKYELKKINYKKLIVRKNTSEEEEKKILKQLELKSYTKWFETEFIHKNSSILPVEIRMYIQKDKSNKEDSIYIIVRDLKEKKESEEKNRIDEQLLIEQSKLAALGEMLSAISHQWRQPLNVIKGTLGNITDAKEYKELTDEYLVKQIKIADDNVNFLSQTINDFKKFFKPSTKKEEFNVYEAIDSARRILSAQLESRKIIFEIDCKDKDIIINGHINELEHVIINLVNNAKDAFEELIKEDLKVGFSSIININIEKIDKNIHISVSDNGKGIAKEIQNRIFEPYFTTKEETGGSGIGLYLSRTVINKSFQGTLKLFKSDSESTTFIIILPLS